MSNMTQKPEFIQIPSLTIGKKGRWVLDDELIYYSAILGDEIVVDKGFDTDLASIPRIFTPIHPKNGLHRPAAIVHDWLVKVDGFNRETADRIFYECMRLLEVTGWRRVTMYLGVRVISIGVWIKNLFRKKK